MIPGSFLALAEILKYQDPYSRRAFRIASLQKPARTRTHLHGRTHTHTHTHTQIMHTAIIPDTETFQQKNNIIKSHQNIKQLGNIIPFLRLGATLVWRAFYTRDVILIKKAFLGAGFYYFQPTRPSMTFIICIIISLGAHIQYTECRWIHRQHRVHNRGARGRGGMGTLCIDSGADKRPLPSNAPPKQAATLKQKRSLQAL